MLWQKQGTRWDKRNCGPTCIWTTSQACLVRLAELHCRQSLFFSLPSKCSLIETLEPTGLGNSVSCLLVTFEFYFSTGKVVNPDPDGYSKRQLLSWRRKQNQNRLPHHALRSSTPWPLPIAPVTLELWQCCSHAHAITSPIKDQCLHVRIICLSLWVGDCDRPAELKRLIKRNRHRLAH